MTGLLLFLSMIKLAKKKVIFVQTQFQKEFFEAANSFLTVIAYLVTQLFLRIIWQQ